MVMVPPPLKGPATSGSAQTSWWMASSPRVKGRRTSRWVARRGSCMVASLPSGPGYHASPAEATDFSRLDSAPLTAGEVAMGVPHVLVTRGVPAPVLERLAGRCEPDVWEGDGVMPRAELLGRVAGKAGIMAMLTDRVDAELLDRAGPSLRVVANFAVGYDNLDLDACTARRVLATNTPDVVTEATADLAWALLLAAARRVAEGDRFLRAARPWIWGPEFFLGTQVHGKTLGVLGLRRMKPTAVLVNTARGPIVDEAALARALRGGEIGAAGLDVFEREPEVHPDLLGLDNVTIVPHLGTATVETRVAMGMTAADNLLAVLDGRRPPHLLNPDAWD